MLNRHIAPGRIHLVGKVWQQLWQGRTPTRFTLLYEPTVKQRGQHLRVGADMPGVTLLDSPPLALHAGSINRETKNVPIGVGNDSPKSHQPGIFPNRFDLLL